MEISVNRCNGYWELDPEGMRAVILGKIQWKKCYECDSGIVYVNYDGEIISPSQAEEDEHSYRDTCEECHGMGLVYVGEV